MNKQEFLIRLEKELLGKVTPAIMKESLDYYKGYISEQVISGRTEQEILEALGAPELLAKSIIDAHGGAMDMGGEEPGADESASGHSGFHLEMNGGKWYVPVLIVAVIVIILFLFIKIISFLFWPAVILLVIWAIYRYWTNRN